MFCFKGETTYNFKPWLTTGCCVDETGSLQEALISQSCANDCI